MERGERTYGLLVGLILVSICLFTSCSKEFVDDGKVVFTQVPIESVSDDQIKNYDFRYAKEMKIVMAVMGTALQNLEILTHDFHSARAPELSYDGISLVFSAQKNEKDVWQIWTMDLDGKEIIQVTQSDQNCTDPVWLPDGRIAYSKLVRNEKTLKFHALFTIGSDGCCEQRISFQPHEDLSASVINDGRILVSSQQVYPEKGILKYLAMRPDGTKAELFYQTTGDVKIVGKAMESHNRDLIFTESNQLVSVSFNRPLHSKKVIESSSQGIFLSAFPMNSGQLLASIKRPGERTFGLMTFNLSNAESADFDYNNSDYHSVEPVMVMKRTVPKKLPSRVNMDVGSGYFICMNAGDSELKIEAGKTSKVQVLGMDKVLGETEVEEDGSFYLELAADKPVRFQALDESGKILRGPSSWMWVRPNERRGCIGCHENREIAPENVVPIAIEKAPVAMIK